MILRDEERGFLGSQSLRSAELDRRREVGLLFHDRAIASKIRKVFDEDWSKGKASGKDAGSVDKAAKKVAKMVTKKLNGVTAVLNEVVALETKTEKLRLDKDSLEESVKDAVKAAVRDVVQDAVKRESSHAKQ